MATVVEARRRQWGQSGVGDSGCSSGGDMVAARVLLISIFVAIFGLGSGFFHSTPVSAFRCTDNI